MLNINHMYVTCHIMLLSTIEAMESDTTKTALSNVFDKDEILNKIQDDAIQIISRHLHDNPTDAQALINLYVVVRKLERVGDHVKNIAEEIIFHKEARILRHKKNKLKN
jgi:phosphate transport system protein